MLCQIGNTRLTATLDTMGGCLTGLCLDGNQYLWQGDERWWSGQAPVLFPIVGNLRDGHATCANGEANMGRHGLARRNEHRVVDADDTHVTFEFASTDATRKAFPYDFALRMTYSVVGETSLEQHFEIENIGDTPLPYCVGGHPAFNVPCPGSDTPFGTWELHLARPWTYSAPSLDLSAGTLDFQKRWSIVNDSDRIRMDHAIFNEHDTIVLEGVPNNTATLLDPISGHGVRLDFPGFDYLGVWSAANDAPFVAVEPWTGCATAADEDDVLEHKRGMASLAPGTIATHAFTITLL